MTDEAGRIRNAARRARWIAGNGRLRSFGDHAAQQLGGYNLLNEARRALLPNYRLTEVMKLWFEDSSFFSDFRRFDETDRSSDRKFFLRELLKLADPLDGDTAEAGVHAGASSWFICQARRSRGSTHWGFDSFEGLSEPSARDGWHWSAGDLNSSETNARELLEPLGAHILKGWIPDVFTQAGIERLAFAHVDVDLYEPTRASIEFFYDLLVPGGLLVCDDYGFTSCPGATQAVDEFMATRPEPVLHCPTGQGIVIKR